MMSQCWQATVFGTFRTSGCPLAQNPVRHVQRHPRQTRPSTVGAKGKDADEGAPDKRPNALSVTIKRKVRQVADVLVDMGEEIAADRLQSATRSPASPPHRLSRLIQERIPYGKPVLVAEVCRPSPSSTSQDVAKLAVDYVSWGVDAIAVPTDLEETPAGLSDLFAVCRAVKVPVLQWDWFVHPLQVAGE